MSSTMMSGSGTFFHSAEMEVPPQVKSPDGDRKDHRQDDGFTFR